MGKTSTPEDCRLIEPVEELVEEYSAYVDEFRAVEEPYVCGEVDEANGDVVSLVRLWREHAAGRNLPEGWVPCSRYWLVRGGRILGTSRFRHRLTEALEDHGGHIGYEVRPSERGKGYATCMLEMTLGKARELGLGKVMLTCDADNAASRRVIEKNGGRLARQGVSNYSGKETLWFWIELNEG